MKKTKKLFGLLSLIMLFISTAFAPGSGYQIGDTVEDFNLKNVDGKMVSMANYADAKGFIVIFTCNTCPYAKMYEKRIIELDDKYAQQGYPVLAINPNDKKAQPGDSYEAMQSISKKKSYPFPYLYDQTQDVAKQFGATRTPHVYILQKEGNITVVKYIGAIDDNFKDADAVNDKFVEQAMTEVMAGKPVSNPTTKAIGCSIKWKQS